MKKIVDKCDIIKASDTHEREVDEAVDAVNKILTDKSTTFPVSIPIKVFGKYGTVSVAVLNRVRDAGWFVVYREQRTATDSAVYTIS